MFIKLVGPNEHTALRSVRLGMLLPWFLGDSIPYVGKEVVQWVRGGFAVDNATLTRFFPLHFLIPSALAAKVLIHVLFLHQTGSNNPLGLNKNTDKIPFYPYFTATSPMGKVIQHASDGSLCGLQGNVHQHLYRDPFSKGNFILATDSRWADMCV